MEMHGAAVEQSQLQENSAVYSVLIRLDSRNSRAENHPGFIMSVFENALI